MVAGIFIKQFVFFLKHYVSALVMIESEKIIYDVSSYELTGTKLKELVQMTRSLNKEIFFPSIKISAIKMM